MGCVDPGAAGCWLYLRAALVLRLLSGVGVSVRLSQLSQLSLLAGQLPFVLRLEGLHPHLQLLLVLLQLFYLPTELPLLVWLMWEEQGHKSLAGLGQRVLFH